MGRPKKSATAASARGQNQLSFKSKITKPSAPTTRAGKAADQKPAKPAAPIEIRPESPSAASGDSTPAEPKSADQKADQKLALRPQSAASANEQPEPPKELSTDERDALQLPEARIKKYWKAKEDARVFPRVHQQNLPVYERILREFDLSSNYGPCIGIERSQRWHRAQKLGLKPPLEVLAVLMKSDAPAQKKERSQVDELMNHKFSIET